MPYNIFAMKELEYIMKFMGMASGLFVIVTGITVKLIPSMERSKQLPSSTLGLFICISANAIKFTTTTIFAIQFPSLMKCWTLYAFQFILAAPEVNIYLCLPEE